ncbi:MAG: hypothetical protein NWE95_12105 [Candidatus Bathyarchaeota archaeon]|nr:hypothetical protein [Candidatus Bathyarchaeota archaeon]
MSNAPKFEELFPIASTLESASDENDAFVQIADAWEMPAANKEQMTREDILRLSSFPGYFTPNQISVQVVSKNSEQMQLDSDPQPVKTIIILDEEAVAYYVSFDPWHVTWLHCCIWADNILEGGDDYLEVPYGIDFQTEWNYICYWDSPDYMDYYGLLDLIDGVDPTGVGCDVMVLMSGQYGGSSGNSQILGLANQMGRHFVMDVTIGSWPFYYPVENLFQHEASHLFDCSDHLWDYTYCIMNYRYTFQYRGYCTGCNTQLERNAGRFD